MQTNVTRFPIERARVTRRQIVQRNTWQHVCPRGGLFGMPRGQRCPKCHESEFDGPGAA